MTPYYSGNGITVYYGRMEDHQDMGGDVLITDPPFGSRKYKTDLFWSAAYLPMWRSKFVSMAVMAFPELLAYWLRVMDVPADEWITWWPNNKAEARARPLPRETEHIAIFGATPGEHQILRPRKPDAFARKMAIQRGHDPDWVRDGDVWRDAAPGMASNSHLRLHPNEKPISLGNKLVTLCSLPGQTVVDYFAGSGTFVLAAANLGRKAIAVEMDESNCETIANRFRGRLL